MRWCSHAARARGALGHARAHRFALWAGLATAFFAPLSAFAAPTTIQFRGQDISYEGAEIKWIGEKTSPTAELLLIYTNCAPDAINTFWASRNVTARILAIGGGGAGGTVHSGDQTKHPGGGGGGAGEFFDQPDQGFAGSKTYGFFIGAGGQPQGSTTEAKPGLNGGASAITNLTDNTQSLLVNGGGGGGGESVGQDGGSGGGGSNEDAAGGSAVKNESDGKGNAGGTSKRRFAAGGGGAGAVGEDGYLSGTSQTAGHGGNGGDGLESDIDPDNIRFYAGGGGGGNTASANDGTEGKGGKGGGGQGGKSLNTDPCISTPGEPATGSGGGGGGRYKPGSAGGSGIIIIRLTGIEQPMIWQAVKMSAGGNDGYVFIDKNAGYKQVGDDLVIFFTNVVAKGGLSFALHDDMEIADREKYKDNPAIWAKARILAVGGGGGGGMVDVQGNARGGGGGGGAGGVVDQSDIIFNSNGVYSITIGTGGAGADRNGAAGKNGGNSFVVRGEESISGVAIGGGGGGAASDDAKDGAGLPGGSGGGASRAYAGAKMTGGAGTAGQGFAGGDGADSFEGGGGGGAGGKGGNSTGVGGGAGGAGVTNSITGSPVVYAGGGGGAFVNANDTTLTKFPGGAGGSGIGGHGAGIEGGVKVAATAGAANTGSGGGGGVSSVDEAEKAGNGGHGVVIIRLSGFVVKHVPYPVPAYSPNPPFVYDGNAHTGVVEFYAYDLRGTPVATNANVYTVQAYLKSGSPYTWEPGHSDGDPITWKIDPMKVNVPGASSNFVYNATVRCPVDKGRFHVDGEGYAWVTNNLPGALGKMLKYCKLEDYEKTDYGSYDMKATLYKKDQAFATVDAVNFAWDVMPPVDPQIRTWRITQAPNVISNFYYAGYRWPDRIKAHHPTNQFDVAWGRETAVTKYRRDNGDGTFGEWQDWGTDGPAANGNYEVWVKIPEPTPKNWQSSEATLKFGTWEKWSDIFTDRMEITVSGNTSGGTELENFPVPVRIHAPTNDGYEVFSGFDYKRAGATGREIHFFDQDGDPVEHDVDMWTTRGESLVWVRVPSLKNTTTKLMMCWRRVNGISLPAYDGTRVWSDYAAVWHMSKLEGGHITDATGNERSLFRTGRASVSFDSNGKMGREATVHDGDLRAENIFTNATDAAVLHTYNRSGDQATKTVGRTDRQITVATDGATVDEARLMKAAPSDKWKSMEAASAKKDVCTYGRVIRDELTCDWWETTPAVTPEISKEGSAPEAKKGSYKDAGGGDAVTYVCRDMKTGAETTNELQGAIGYYQVTFDHTNPAGYWPRPHTVGYYVIKAPNPTNDLGGAGGDSGRILLMNADDNAGYAVANQGWDARSEDGVTRWAKTAGDWNDGTNNILGGTSFELVRCADAKVLWTLRDCRMGNTFPTNNADALSADFCYLPESSSTARSVTNEDVMAERRGDAGWVLMRNSADACILSSCFTNGIGTIYFDAVNSRKAVTSGAGRNDDGYRLVLEFATKTRDGLPPLDENCWLENEDGTTNWYGKLEGMWQKATLSPVRYAATTVCEPVTDELALKMATGGQQQYFYRVHAPLVKYGPVRFRIRRMTVDTTAGSADDGFILLDNLIVSAPPVSATLKPYGRFDKNLTGEDAVGFGGAFGVPFPSLAGSAFPGRCRVELPPGTDVEYGGKAPSEYISMAQMFYRWRYLGQAEPWRMAVLSDDGTDAMKTPGDLEVPADAGDLEFYFVSMMKTAYYQYVDYTGLGKPVLPGDSGSETYTEEITKKPSVMDLSEYGVSRLASGGTNYYVRVRDGASAWERMTLEIRGVFTNDCPMRLVGDGTWRALLPVPTNVEGRCTFRFRGRNRQSAGSKDYALNETVWGGGAEEVELPRNGVLSVGGAATPFELDHVSGYVEFRLGADDGDSPTWSASRAEYQSFNDWHDVWSSPESQVFTPGTNGVDSLAMRTENADMTDWAPYVSTNTAWNEPFVVNNYSTTDYEKEKFFQNHATPTAWNARNLTFVSKNLVSWGDQDTKSGLAVKLKGHGDGSLEYSKSNNPKGLENIRFSARVGQSIDFDDVSFSAMEPRKKNYTFLCPVSMSRNIPSDTEAGDMSVGGAVSLFAYYRASKGSYEFRATRAASGKELLLELFKWSVDEDGVMAQKRLCGQRFNAANNELRLWDDSGDVTPGYFGMFISAETTGSGTKLVGGVWKGKSNGTKSDMGDLATSSFTGGDAAQGYGGLVCTDTDDPHTSGAYGVAAKDCPAEFIRPRHVDSPVYATPAGQADTTTYEGGKYFNPSANQRFDVFSPLAQVKYDYADIDDDGWELGQQVEICANGLRTRLGLSQEVVVELQEKRSGVWTEAGRVPVSGYALSDKTLQVHRTGDWNLRLRTGQKAVDVVIGKVEQRQWQGLSYESMDYSSDTFVFTQGVVLSNDLRQAKETLLQPARGVVTQPLSVRSPVLDGLGKISFSYEDADPNAEIWVQVATNNVDWNLTTTGGYSLSVDSVDLEETRSGTPAPPGTWITVAKFGASTECSDGPLGRSGYRTVYLGWHNQAREPVRGAYRVFIPQRVVEQAIVLATNETQNVDYGRITVTGMTVTDEPGISERSWRGWNLRTAGDVADAEERMFLDDGQLRGDVGHGLVCALNNSVNDVRGDDTETAAFNNPTIWSPTLETVDGKSRSIGSVTFRARLYHAGDARETETGGVVSLYGATSSTSENWTKLGDIRVTSSTFSNFTWTALGERRYRAVRLEVSGPAAKTMVPDRDRVILDEIVLTEKLDAKIGFVYVRPFRTNLYEPVEIEDIESPNEQPIVGESWGVQTKLRLDQLGREVSGLQVCLKYFEGERPWGYGNWKERTSEVQLVPVGDPKDGIYRSVGTTPESLVQPLSSAGVVQYMVILRYAGEGEETAVQQVEKDDWAQPSWYWPVDYNEKNGGYADPDKFSPYAVIDTVSPGRAWINEVNWNDGPSKETHTESTVKTNQFIEICVPSGMDMTGWYLRATDLNLNKWVMAKFGQGGVRSSKITEHAVNNFEFMLLESPETNLAGGIRDAEGNPVETDGTWTSDGPSGTADSGSLSFNRPWQFELVRPSGIVEHQIVVGGTNTMSQYTYGYIYDATNLQAKLDRETPSPKRFLAGDELARSADGSFASFGVIGGNDEGNPPPGGDGTWKAPMKFTPGRVNEGQEIPAGWYLAPNGTNSWVTLTVVGDYLTQEVGGESAKVIKLVVPQGTSTNVTYRTKSWYEVERLTVDGGTVAEHQARYGQPWTYALTPTGQLCNVVATEGFDCGLDKFRLHGDPYEPAVMKWLSDKYPDAKAEDIQLAAYKGLGKCDQAFTLGLVDMYWLDIPPVPMNDAERANAEAGNTNWWFRGGVTDLRADQYRRTRHYGYGDVTFTNSQVDIQLYISNAVSGVAHAPQYLQGIHNEKSSAYSGAWGSETFQILGNLKLTPDPGRKEQGYMPFRCFVFDSGSFTGPEDNPPFSSTIEILDPFSTESPGYSYGWPEHKGEGFYFRWTLTTNSVPASVETLKANDTYGDSL